MSAMTNEDTATGLSALRVLREGYGEGAWHGPDLKAALADVTADTAFRRPAAGRHNIAEIALHHAYCVRGVRSRLTGIDSEPFVLEGDDWFALDGTASMPWSKVLEVVQSEQDRLAKVVAEVSEGRTSSPLAGAERFDLVLGITCHAVYHAGQIQLIKKLL